MGQLRLVPKSQSKSDFWQHHVQQQQASKLSAAAYCRRHQLTYAGFLYWKGKAAADAARPASPVLPSPALEEPAKPPGMPRPRDPQKASGSLLSLRPYQLQLTADFDADTLRRLLPLLEGGASC